MSEGPISQARRSWLPPKVSTNPASASHWTDDGHTPYCRSRVATMISADPLLVTCSTCIANRHADYQAG